MRHLRVGIAIVAAMVGLGIVGGPADPAFAGGRAFVGSFHGKHHGHFPHGFRGGKVFVGKPFFGPTVFVKRPFIGARVFVSPPVIVIR